MRWSGLFFITLGCGCNLVTGLDEFAVESPPAVVGSGGAGGTGDTGGAGGMQLPSACMAELSDGFDSLAIDAAKWEVWMQPGAEVQATGTDLRVQWTGGVAMHGGVMSLAQLALRGCAISIEVVRVPGVLGTQAFFYVGEEGNRAGIAYMDGQLHFVVQSGSLSDVPIVYTPEYRFWRMQEKAGTLHFETSNDGANWTMHASQDSPPLFASPQRLNIGAGLATPTPEAGAADALFDTVRVGP